VEGQVASQHGKQHDTQGPHVLRRQAGRQATGPGVTDLRQQPLSFVWMGNVLSML
jgi:hypothetical protein